mmetsp:Transcript_18599/g.43536  ORF Transcript_18599/g.43536 Transcript_18599/m.43536 type:complete len:430 (+) Transcript_18599:2478-3767(+)
MSSTRPTLTASVAMLGLGSASNGKSARGHVPSRMLNPSSSQVNDFRMSDSLKLARPVLSRTSSGRLAVSAQRFQNLKLAPSQLTEKSKVTPSAGTISTTSYASLSSGERSSTTSPPSSCTSIQHSSLKSWPTANPGAIQTSARPSASSPRTTARYCSNDQPTASAWRFSSTSSPRRSLNRLPELRFARAHRVQGSTTTPPGVPASAPASATMDELLASSSDCGKLPPWAGSGATHNPKPSNRTSCRRPSACGSASRLNCDICSCIATASCSSMQTRIDDTCICSLSHTRCHNCLARLGLAVVEAPSSVKAVPELGKPGRTRICTFRSLASSRTGVVSKPVHDQAACNRPTLLVTRSTGRPSFCSKGLVLSCRSVNAKQPPSARTSSCDQSVPSVHLSTNSRIALMTSDLAIGLRRIVDCCYSLLRVCRH